MKKHPEIKEIYHRFLRNEATAAEIDLLFAYFKTGEDMEMRKLIAIDPMTDAISETVDPKRSAHLADLQARINVRIDAGAETAGGIAKYPLHSYFNSGVFRFAASLLLVAFLSFFLYNYLKPPVAEIMPGGNYATLLTADGKKVDLKAVAPAAIAKIQGVVISKTADGQIVYTAEKGHTQATSIWNSIVTPLGGKYRVRLSDGTIVILNSGSKLEFPVGFHGPERRVKLIGEAYFEVTKDPSRPFMVVSGDGSTEVLGTKFNVSNYPEDRMVKTTLLEGKVKFSRNDMRGGAQVLNPGEQAILNGDAIQVIQVNAADLMAWKDNKFVFKNVQLAAVMRQLSRWYNIEVDYNSLPDRRLYVNISCDVNLSEVLRMMSVTSGIKFNVEGRRVSVTQ